jgi:hypothetical protein
MDYKDVRSTFLSTVVDAIDQIECRHMTTSMDLLKSILQRAREASSLDILERFPMRFRGFNTFLATGVLPDEDADLARLVIEYEQGTLVDDRIFEAIYLYRQVFGLYSRLTVGGRRPNSLWGVVERPSSMKTDEEAITDALDRLTDNLPGKVPAVCRYIAATLTRHWDLSALQTAETDVPFRHGPGATAERSRMKSDIFRVDDEDMDWVAGAFFRPLFPENPDGLEQFQGRYHASNGKLLVGADSSRILAVPKDFRGPRIIAAEPVLHQYVQQGVARLLYRHVRRSPLKRAINLERADLNGQLALSGSKDRSVVTIDLSDASDSVKVWHIEEIFHDSPILPYLLSARTKYVQSFRGKELISTFAPMGSGLCFITETLVFALLALSSAWPKDRSISSREIARLIAKMKLRVYGDDIIVDHEYAENVLTALRDAGFRPNMAKTCTATLFRESCGTDAYDGHDISVLRPRLLPGASSFSYAGLLDMARQFYARGFNNTACALLRYVCKRQKQALGAVAVPFVYNDEQFATSPWVFPISLMTSEGVKLNELASRQRIIVVASLRSYPERPDLLRRLWESLNGNPRDEEGFVLRIENRKTTEAMRHRRLKANSMFPLPHVWVATSYSQVRRLLLR